MVWASIGRSGVEELGIGRSGVEELDGMGQYRQERGRRTGWYGPVSAGRVEELDGMGQYRQERGRRTGWYGPSAGAG